MRTRVASLMCVVFVMVVFVSVGTAIAEASDDTASTTTAKVKAAGISLRHPATWTVMPRTRRNLSHK